MLFHTLLHTFLFVSCCNYLWLALAEDIYHYLPEYSVSHCSRRLNTTGHIGCSTNPKNNSGLVLILNDVVEFEDFLARGRSSNVVLVINLDLFLNQSLMNELRHQPEYISGVVVFPLQHPNIYPYSPFSESTSCPNSLYSYYGSALQCNVTPIWNPHGSSYSAIAWPFPILLVQSGGHKLKSELFSCYQQFNVNPVDDTRCMLELSNRMSAVTSSALCIRRQSLMGLPIFESPVIYCEEFNGINVVLSATNTSVSTRLVLSSTGASSVERSHNSSIVVLTRLDSRSMFERSGFASLGALPAVSILVSVAAHLVKQPTFHNLQLRRDLFFAFLDNEAYDFMGSGRLAYDLRERIVAAYTGFPLGWDHIYALIELGELGSPENASVPTYYGLFDRKIYEKNKFPMDELMGEIFAANERFGQINVSRAPDSLSSLPLPPTASLQSLLSSAPRPLPHILLSDHSGPPIQNKYFESFLDILWPTNPHSDRWLLVLANTLADAIHRLVAKDSSPMISAISYPAPGDLMNCFINNVSCDMLKKFLSPQDLQFLEKLQSPIPAQSYLPLDSKELKVSHIVSMLLMGLTSERTSADNCSNESKSLDPYVYLMGYYNGAMQCYRTLLNLATRFALFEEGVPASPAWMRSRTVHNIRYVRWYRGSSVTIDAVGVAIGIFFVLITSYMSLFVRRKVNAQLAHRGFNGSERINRYQREQVRRIMT